MNIEYACPPDDPAWREILRLEDENARLHAEIDSLSEDLGAYEEENAELRTDIEGLYGRLETLEKLKEAHSEERILGMRGLERIKNEGGMYGAVKTEPRED